MTEPAWEGAAVPVRAEVVEAQRAVWRRLARPGAWFDGATRVAVAAETRNAPACALCAARKAALSPAAVAGAHDSLGALPDVMVDAVHRIVTDPARLSRGWYEGLLADGLADTEYVELVGVVCQTVSVDTFARALGAEPWDLPAPVAGAPARRRPEGVKPGAAWVPWIAPEDAAGTEADLYTQGKAHIRRALSAAPDEQRGFFALVDAQYLSGPQIRDFATDYRAITRAQIELLAGRISALNQCVY